MEHFSVKEIWKQIGLPTGESIRSIYINLNSNAISVSSNLGDGHHRPRAPQNQTLMGHTFTRPSNSGIAPPTGYTFELPTHRADCIQQWEDQARTYKLHVAINTAL
eukprot:5068271-Ditylum_brightwellii.AAC.1